MTVVKTYRSQMVSGLGLFGTCLFLLSCFGCATGGPPPAPVAPERIACQDAPAPRSHHDGSLWQDDGPLGELFINPKARRAGDIVTIKIVESSSASNKASTKTDRESSLSAGIDSFFGAENDYSAAHGFFNPFSRVKGDLSSEFDGNGTTTRSGDLTAYITARVTAVLPNGNLEIRGSREVTVNNEKQMIGLSGIIRSRDISPNNVILSTYISDAKIFYSGEGIIDERQKPGWLARGIDKIWPF